MKRKLMIAAIAAALFSAAAWAQWGPGMGYGYGMGPGIMGGYGGYGMGPGMMGGYGMGRGMMGGYGWDGGYGALALTDEQRDKILEIRKEASNKRWGLMQSMHALRWANVGPDAKETDARKTYEAMAEIRKQMFETTLDADKRIDEVLTKGQKEQLRKERRRGW